MKKSHLISIVFVVIGVSLYFFSQSNVKKVSNKKELIPTKRKVPKVKEKSETETFKASPQVKDLEVISKSISKEVSKTDYWNKTIDFTLSEREILQKVDPIKVYEHSKQIISDISKCINEHCGISPDQDGYFDPKNTTADKLLARNLKLLNLVSEDSAIFNYHIDEINFDEVFNSNNSEVQLEGVKLYLRNKDSVEDIQGLFSKAKSFDDSVKGQFFSHVDEVTRQSPELRNDFVSSISKMLKDDNGNTVVEISENIHKLDLDIEEAQRIMKETCSTESSRIKKVLSVNFNEYLSNKNLNTTYEETCN